MPLTKPFEESVIDRAKREPEYRAALIGEALESITDGDVESAKRILRDYVLASTSFVDLARSLDKKPESIMRMLSKRGNPTMKNMGDLLSQLKEQDGVKIRVEVSF